MSERGVDRRAESGEETGTEAGDSRDPGLVIRLLGLWEVQLHGRPLPALRSRKGQWLLALLALHRGNESKGGTRSGGVSRSWLAGLLWPENSQAQALYNLRRNLSDLRRALGPEATRLQSPSPNTVSLDLLGAVVDVAAFDERIARGDERSLEEAIRLYRGPLLADCTEEWILPERTTREQAYLSALETLARSARERGEPAATARYLRQAVAVEPLRESAQMELMEALVAAGDGPAASQVYGDFRRRLQREARMAPAPEMTALFQRISAARDGGAGPGTRAAGGGDGATGGRGDGGIGRASTRPLSPSPGLPVSAAPPSNLPLPLSSFIGRERELADVEAALRAARLVTLTGTGGVGKTRLALQLGRQILADYPEGVWFVELAGLAAAADPALVAQSVARILGVSEQPPPQGPALGPDPSPSLRGVPGQDGPHPRSCPLHDTLREWLKSKRLLLILDNCEHLLDPAARLAASLLESCPELRILATSRQSLGLTGEVVWRVPSLSVPGEGVGCGVWGVGPDRAGSEPYTLTQPDAVRLFLERGRAVNREFALTEQNEAAVASVCRRLDGLPLAIELAAARLKALTVEEIAARLEGALHPPRAPERSEAGTHEVGGGYPARFRLLTGGSRAAPTRQQTLAAAIDWSYELLSEPERALLQRLSVFAGNFSLGAAEAVGRGQGGHRRRVPTRSVGGLVLLSGQDAAIRDSEPVAAGLAPDARPLTPEFLDLLESLVEKSLVMAEGCEEGRRFRLLETVREYAAAQMSDAAKEAGARRHAGYYLALAEQTAPVLLWPEPSAARKRLEREQENLRAALAWAQTRGEAAIALRLGAALWRFWWLQGNLREGRDRLSEVLAFPQVQSPTAARAQALQGAGRINDSLGDPAAAMSLTQQGLAVWQQVGDSHGIADALNQLGDLELDQNELPAAQLRYEGALALYRQLQDRAGIAQTSYNLAQVAFKQEDVDRADALLAECRRLCQELGDRSLSAAVLADQGWAALARGDVPRARMLFDQALDLRRDLGVRQPIAWSLLNVAQAARLQNDLEAARAAAAESLTICREMDHRPGIGWALSELADAVYSQGEIEAAAALYEESLAVAQKLGNTRGVAGLLTSLGRVSLRRRDTQAADTQFTEALSLQRKLGHRCGEAWALEGLAEVAAAQQEPQQATRLLGAAARIWERLPGQLPSLDPGSTEALLARLRRCLGDEAFTALWESGGEPGESQDPGTGVRKDAHDG